MTNTEPARIVAAVGRIAGSERFALVIAPDGSPTEPIVSTTARADANVLDVLGAYGYRPQPGAAVMTADTMASVSRDDYVSFYVAPVAR